RQRLGRGHGYRVAGVDAHGIEVLDGADDDAVVRPVPHDLELVLLPPGDGALDEDLVYRAGGQALGGDVPEGVVVVGHARARAAEDVGRPDDQRITDLVADLHGFVQFVGETGGR